VPPTHRDFPRALGSKQSANDADTAQTFFGPRPWGGVKPPANRLLTPNSDSTSTGINRVSKLTQRVDTLTTRAVTETPMPRKTNVLTMRPKRRNGPLDVTIENSSMLEVPKADCVGLLPQPSQKPDLIIDGGDLPATARDLRDLLAQSRNLFDRGVPVRWCPAPTVIPPPRFA
jgi:hypothetical protein